MAAGSSTRKVVYAALVGNLLIAVTKFGAAVFTGSSAMLSEGVHSLVDTSNQVLLLYGMHRAARPPDLAHPLGHGRELYFWSFVVALLVFALGAGVSLFEGISHILRPEPTENLIVAYLVLALSFVFEGYSWWLAVREFRASKGSLGWIEAVRRSKDPTSFTVLFEDSAALLGILIAAGGIGASSILGKPAFDGFASIGIGIVLAVTAIFLARETKSLLIGERAHPELQAELLRIAAADPAIHRANGVLTVQLGADQVVAALSAEFHDDLTAPQIEAAVDRLEAAIGEAQPHVTTLFVKPQTAGGWREQEAEIAAASKD